MIHAKFRQQLGEFALDVDIELPGSGVTALFGPSGSGKTSLLRCMAGLQRACGNLTVNDQLWQDENTFLPVHRRALGYVFQEAALFEHLPVRGNLEYGYRRIPQQMRRISPDQVIDWLGLDGLIDRKQVSGLSGGERQRIAIGRALLTSPRLLLMDEPLSALDEVSRCEILPSLAALHRELDIPVIYVSHALNEVARLADHLLLLQGGRIIAAGAADEILARLDLPTAHLEDSGVIQNTVIDQHDENYQQTRLQFSGGSLLTARIDLAPGSLVRVRILARDVSIATCMPQGSSISNILPAHIDELCDEGPDRVMVRMRLSDTFLLARITRRSRDLLQLKPGMAVYAQIKSVVLGI